MKVPALNKRINRDFISYINDFDASLQSAISSNKDKNEFFKIIHPLFVMIESLTSPPYFIDPSKRLLLNAYHRKKDKVNLIKIYRKMYEQKKDSELILSELKKERFTPYIDELYSDLLLLINNFYINNYRSCYMLSRRILENVYRHMYYKDHKEEFWRINSLGEREEEIGLSPKEFRERLTKTSYLKIFNTVDWKFGPQPNGNTLFKLNNDLYKESSAYIHASNSRFMSLYKSNSEIIFNDEQYNKLITMVKKLAHIIAAFLIAAHLEQFTLFNDYEKTLILNSFGGKSKHNFRELLNI